MKFSWTPPFIVKSGKFKLSRTLPSFNKEKISNFHMTRASYRPIERYDDHPTSHSKSSAQRLAVVEEADGKNNCSGESSARSSKVENVEFESAKLAPPNKKKQGVSGHSSEVSKIEKASDIRLPKYEKDEEDEELIRSAIRGNEFLKEGLFACKDVIQAVVDAMYLKKVAANTHVIREGEVGSHMYVCAEGTIEVYKKSEKVNTLGPGKLFGELALLYNSKRNATILAMTQCKFWVLDRKVFLQIMKKSGMQMTENRVKFLRSVPLLSKLDSEVLIKMTDILKLRSYSGGTVIIRQGDEGSLFYIITGGTVSVTITQTDGTIKQGPILKAGDFFGEKALLKDEKRAATVTAQEPGVECLTLDRVNFIEYLGGLQEVQDVAFDRKIPIEETQESEYGHVQLSDLDIVGTLGIGAFGRVELVQLKDQHTVFALKCVKKVDVVDLGQQEHVFNEKENMMLCRSPFIIRMYNTYKSNKYLYFLMEVCQGGDVWSLLQKRRFFDETLARFTTACMVEAFDYLHARGIAYRDLKPENVLYDSKGYAKLADFGFSKKLGPTTKTWTFAGTPEYVAPEIILNEGHNRAVDYWTLGIFVHELLVGKSLISRKKPNCSHVIGPEILFCGLVGAEETFWGRNRVCKDLMTDVPALQQNQRTGNEIRRQTKALLPFYKNPDNTKIKFSACRPPFRGNNHSRTYTLILKGIDSVNFPRHMSKTVQLFIKKLCKRVPAERLGYQREGINGIKRHKWFQNFDWISLQQTTMKAPYTPKLNGLTDMSNFDKYAKEKEIPPDEFGDWDANF